MKRNIQKRLIPIAAMQADFVPKNGDVPLSAEMKASTQSMQKENIVGKRTRYSHTRAHFKFENGERTACLCRRSGATGELS